MTNTQWAICLYIIGMFILIYKDILDEEGIKFLREQIWNEMPFSKRTNCILIVLMCLIVGLIWPYCWFSDVVKFFKKRS